MIEAAKNNPVRILSVVSAVLALVAVYVPDLPTVLILAIAASILGTGEAVRGKVIPTRTVELVDPVDAQLNEAKAPPATTNSRMRF